MGDAGYYRFPAILDSTIVFVCEDDLWQISAQGGLARRLTANLGAVSHPAISPDGECIAFTGREEGSPEVFVMSADGGPSRRLTFQGALLNEVVGWSEDSGKVIFASNATQPFVKHQKLFQVDRDGGLPELLPCGPANRISFGPSGGVVLGRNIGDPARWKRYRGGTCGHLWIDVEGSGQFQRFPDFDANIAAPMWVGDCIYFLADHEGIGNLYSCAADGQSLRRHTNHQQYYARNAATDGNRIVYHAGGDLYLFDPLTESSEKVEIQLRSPRVERNRKFVGAGRYLESADLHPNGHSIAITTRGKPFTAGNWEGPVVQHGVPDGVRYRLASWLNDGVRIVAIDDDGGEESVVVFYADSSEPPRRLPQLEFGRTIEWAVSPAGDQIALHNHRAELVLVDLENETATVLDASEHERMKGICWSPDGRWVAYGYCNSPQTSIVKLCNVEDGSCYDVTEPVLEDFSPSFDPDGRYLYFLSHRVFDPVYDNMHFDLNFPRGVRPYLITLQNDLRSPFLPLPGQNEEEKCHAAEERESSDSDDAERTDPVSPIKIDIEGIKRRIVAFPIPEGRYERILGLPKGSVLFSSSPVEGSLGRSWAATTPPANSTIERFDLGKLKKETFAEEVTDFGVSADGEWVIYRSGAQLRVIKSSEKAKKDQAKDPGRESGWLELPRFKLSVDPPSEWSQMLREAWRLQRDHFWVEDMSGIDWSAIYHSYAPLLDRIATRSEFSDLVWEMQGELGTSHAYEIGGDYRSPPKYRQGFLGADFEYNAAHEGYTVREIAFGDVWDNGRGSPLAAPGIDLRIGDVITAVGSRQLNKLVTPGELLVHQAESEVLLTVVRDGGPPRRVAVKTVGDETPLRYRQWVEANRSYVHSKTGDRIGYVHIPNMGAIGYAEFHRYWLAESRHDGMIIDVRFNGGGHVSQLILEKLLRRRVGYWVRRWGKPASYPENSIAGPLVALTNERAGSDGDKFSHCFKLYKLGPLIGKRTWGGLIGIWPRHSMVDGSVTTQPEFSSWLVDVGWGIENYGTDPDIDVDVTPQEDARGLDPQLDRGVEEVLRMLAENPPELPSFGDRPNLAPPMHSSE